MSDLPEMDQDQPPEAVETGLEDRLTEAEVALSATKDKLLRALADGISPWLGVARIRASSSGSTGLPESRPSARESSADWL